ncbi:MAG: YheT family hydrolase [Flavicella sp.]
MPIVTSSFKTFFPFTNPHISTVYRTLFTNPKITYTRERIDTPDGDFLDLDWSRVNSANLVLLLHGLEGSSDSKYIRSTASILNKNEIDIVAINFRGCSGETNRYFKAYHSGETGDLDFVLNYLLKNYNYTSVSIVGFSMGGNVVLKFAGEQKESLKLKVKGIVAVCPPCDLKGSSEVLSKKSNRVYMKRFLKTLLKKTLEKSTLFPERKLNTENLLQAKDFQDFDNIFTAPSYGFKDAEDYWQQASSNSYLKNIKIPCYIVSSLNDPFLSDSCYPNEIAKKHEFIKLETPNHGGHIGFINSWSPSKNTWCEEKITIFLKELSKTLTKPQK